VSGALKSYADSALVARAGAGLAARLYLGAVREELAKASHVLVVYMLHLVYAEGADLAARDVALAPAGRATSAWSAWATTAATQPEASASTATRTVSAASTASTATRSISPTATAWATWPGAGKGRSWGGLSATILLRGRLVIAYVVILICHYSILFQFSSIAFLEGQVVKVHIAIVSVAAAR
jgi:hypothetical protein